MTEMPAMADFTRVVSRLKDAAYLVSLTKRDCKPDDPYRVEAERIFSLGLNTLQGMFEAWRPSRNDLKLPN